MESLTIASTTIYVAAFIAAFMAGRIAPEVVTDVLRRWRKFVMPSDPRGD